MRIAKASDDQKKIASYLGREITKIGTKYSRQLDYYLHKKGIINESCSYN